MEYIQEITDYINSEGKMGSVYFGWLKTAIPAEGGATCCR